MRAVLQLCATMALLRLQIFGRLPISGPLLASGLLLASGGAVQSTEMLSLASGRNDSPTFAAGVGLASLIKFELLPKERIDLQAVESAGAVDNVRLLQAGDVEFAILPSIVGHTARIGTGSFAGQPPETRFRAVATLWRDALHLIVRNDDVATGTIDDLSRLEDGKLYLGDAATGMVDAGQLLLDDLGMDAAKALASSAIADSDGVAAIRRGEIHAISAAARPPVEMFATLFGELSPDLSLLDVTEQQMVKANGNHWLWTPYMIPASTYPGQDEDVWTIAMSNLLVVRADVDDDVVHAITKSIFENLDYLRRVNPSMANLGLKMALAGVTMPLHPGAHRYYEETGLLQNPATARAPETPAPIPTRQDRLPAEFFERYPDEDVAGEWPNGAGGPLLKTKPSSREIDSEDLQKPVEPHWRHRASL